MELIVKEENEFTKKMRRMGHRIIVDPVALKIAECKRALSPGAMYPALYHFIDSVVVDHHLQRGTPYLRARGAAIVNIDNVCYGIVDNFNVSNLVSGYSNLLVNGIEKKGVTLYQGIAGDNEIEKKIAYIEETILNYTLEVIEESAANCIDWKFIDRKTFLEALNNIRPSIAFQQYMDDKGYEKLKNYH